LPEVTVVLRSESVRRILIVDDHPLYREGVASALTAPPLRAQVLDAATIAQALDVLAHEPDIELALIDLKLGPENGLDAVARIGAAFPSVVRVLISGEDGADLYRAAAGAGAHGYVPKSHSIQQLLAALNILFDGGVYWPRASDAPGGAMQSENALDAHHLTLRQLEVLQLLSDGNSNAQIGARLGVSERTVKAHLQSVYEHLEAHTRVTALNRARELGLLSFNPRSS
jgi:two-component system, NarL family, nitrate/nitrite response regulator NarL